MEDKLNFFSRFKISIFKIKEYSLLLKEDLNKAISYVLTLSVIIGIVLGILQLFMLNKLENNINILLKEESFKFEINESMLDFKASPYKEEQGSTVVIIDSNKTLDNSESIKNITVHKDMSSAFLKDGIVVRYNGDEYKFKYSDISFLDKYINNEVALNILNKAKPIKYIVFIVIILVTYISLLFNALIISIAGIISNKINGSKLKYKDILKISLYSLTLPTIAKLFFPIKSLSIIISAVYVAIAINNITRKEILS